MVQRREGQLLFPIVLVLESAVCAVYLTNDVTERWDETRSIDEDK